MEGFTSIAWKGPPRSSRLHSRAKCPEKTKVYGVSAAARGRRRGITRFAESYPANLCRSIAADGVRRRDSPISDVPYEIVRASFREKPIARVQEMRSHDRILGELGVGANKHNVFSLAFPHGEIEVTYLSTILLVEARVGLVVPEEAALFCREKLFAAGIRNASAGETGRRPLQKARRGLSENHYVVRAVLFSTVKNGGISRLVSKCRRRLGCSLIP